MDNNVDVFEGHGIVIELIDPKSFVMIIETLTRIGIYSEKRKTLTQSCNILHKRGRYAILHFKELYLLDGKYSDITEDDYARRNKIARLLEEWGLCKILPDQIPNKDDDLNPDIKIIPAKDKSEYILVSKYIIGDKRNTKKYYKEKKNE